MKGSFTTKLKKALKKRIDIIVRGKRIRITSMKEIITIIGLSSGAWVVLHFFPEVPPWCIVTIAIALAMLVAWKWE